MAVRFPRLVGREGEDKFEEEDREVEKLVSDCLGVAVVGECRLGGGGPSGPNLNCSGYGLFCLT